LTLQPGDVLTLFTDGITDAKDKAEHEFRMDGVLGALKAGPTSPKNMGERLVAACKKHFAGCKQHDDLTVVCFGRVA
jgi:sigma-B regulation protein RsbU (phosphoserine phosphatase)